MPKLGEAKLESATIAAIRINLRFVLQSDTMVAAADHKHLALSDSEEIATEMAEMAEMAEMVEMVEMVEIVTVFSEGSVNMNEPGKIVTDFVNLIHPELATDPATEIAIDPEDLELPVQASITEPKVHKDEIHPDDRLSANAQIK